MMMDTPVVYIANEGVWNDLLNLNPIDAIHSGRIGKKALGVIFIRIDGLDRLPRDGLLLG